jgi:Kef-type K+ transport system membrane component KefB
MDRILQESALPPTSELIPSHFCSPYSSSSPLSPYSPFPLSLFLSLSPSPLSDGDLLTTLMPLWLVQAIIIMGITRTLSTFGSWFKQPSVIFEIIGGILLGPSALGRNKHFLDRCFPTDSLSHLQVVAEMGLILYLFLVGLELDPQMLLNNSKKAGSIAIMGMAVPFALGVAISPTLYHVLMNDGKITSADDDQAVDDDPDKVDPVSFFVFIGTSLSITAFPVLARILKESGLIYTKAGATAMGAAAIGDAIAWCLLILAISIANATTMTVALWVFLTTVATAVGLFVVVRPVLERVVALVEEKNSPAMEQHLFAFIIIIVFFAAWCTSIIGVHGIFGAFMFGLIIPRSSRLYSNCEHHLEKFVLVICLPIYFALSGLKTDVTQITTVNDGLMVILVCFIATVGKFLGTGIPSYLTGMSKRQSATVAVLMNTRGLVELIVLNLGVESGILNTKVFTVMVLMAVFTTFLTCPLIELIFPLSKREKERENERLLKLQQLVAVSSEEMGGGGHASGVAGEVNSVLGTHLSADVNGIDLIQDTSTIWKPNLIISYLEQLPEVFHLLYALNIDNLSTPAAATQLPHDTPPSPRSRGGVGGFDASSTEPSFQVSVVRCIPPTNSLHDRFLGFDASGEVLHITSHNHDIDSYVHTLTHLDTHQPPPDLFPLSLLCQTIGMEVEIKKMMGDPDAFPHAIHKISTHTSSDLVIMPWKSTEFLTHLFWQTLTESILPVALLIPPAGEGSTLSETTVPIGEVLSPPTLGRRGSSSGVGGSSGVEMTDFSFTSPGGTSTTMTPSHRHHRGSGGVGKFIQRVGVMLTGSPIDTAIFQMTKRLLGNTSLHVTLFLPLTSQVWETSLKMMIDTLRDTVIQIPNLSLVTLPIGQIEFHKLTDQLSSYSFQMVLCSYLEPLESATSGDGTSEMTIPSLDDPTVTGGGGGRGRSESIGDLITDAVGRFMNTTTPTKQSGGTSASREEMGLLGSHLHQLYPRAFTLVFHAGRGAISYQVPTEQSELPV